MSPHVEICSPEEARSILSRLGPDPTQWAGELLHGFVDIMCREADGSVAWEVHQPNLITDLGRRDFQLTSTTGSYIVSSPSNEVADLGRYSVQDDGAATSSQISAPTYPTYDPITYTKTWIPSVAFAAPASTRQVGLIGLSTFSAISSGVRNLIAYTILSPVKTQSTTQTLEVVYKITLTPIY